MVLGDGLALLRDLDLRRQVPALSQPTLVICGDRDTLTPLGASRWLVENLPQARLAMIPGAAHAPQISHAEEFLHALEQFDDARP
ncbi:MAG: hypothetical protein HYZ17_11355 [Betaproteobacteria bacterium]|nr:hypothetical protein [Betaproteobacteria bacterium]